MVTIRLFQPNPPSLPHRVNTKFDDKNTHTLICVVPATLSIVFVPAFFYHKTNFLSTFTITKPHKHAHLRDIHLIKTKQTSMSMVLDLFFIPPTPKFLRILTYKHTHIHQHCTVFCATLSIVLFLFLLTNLRTYGRPKKPNKQEPTTTFTSKQAFTRHCPSFCTTSALFKTNIWHICVHATLSILLYLLFKMLSMLSENSENGVNSEISMGC